MLEFSAFRNAFLDHCSRIGAEGPLAQTKSKTRVLPVVASPQKPPPSPPSQLMAEQGKLLLQQKCDLFRHSLFIESDSLEDGMRLLLATLSTSSSPGEFEHIVKSLDLVSWLLADDSPLDRRNGENQPVHQNLATALVHELLRRKSPALLSSLEPLLSKLQKVLGTGIVFTSVEHDTHQVARRCVEQLQLVCGKQQLKIKRVCRELVQSPLPSSPFIFKNSIE